MGEAEPSNEASARQARLAVIGGGAIAASRDDRGMVSGYNNDVTHRGRTYHVQSEDSGRHKRHIFTHVFHGGTIVASSRIEYDDATTAAEIVRLLRESHKAMLRRLVRGRLDHAIARCLERPPGRGVVVVSLGTPASERNLARIRHVKERIDMNNVKQVVEGIRNDVTGALGVALVDYESGMCLGSTGTGIDIEVAAAGNTEVMKAKSRVMRELGIKGGIEDILITLDSQYHIIRPVGSALFLYLAIDRKQGNLAMARHKLAAAAASVEV